MEPLMQMGQLARSISGRFYIWQIWAVFIEERHEVLLYEHRMRRVVDRVLHEYKPRDFYPGRKYILELREVRK